MDKEGVKKLWGLLKELYPRQAQSETRDRMLAWELALKPYDYDEVKEAALSHARESGFYPSINEITANLPKTDPKQTDQRSGNAWMERYLDDTYQGRFKESGVSKYARDNGITWEEAKNQIVG